MLPGPRIIVIDDNLTHLQQLAEGLGVDGIGCLQVYFTGDPDVVRNCPQVRVIFADLHLNDSAANTDNAAHFALIGSLLENRIVPAGPYVLILWTRYAKQAEALKAYLERLETVPKPFAVKALDKNIHLKDDKVVDAAKLIAEIKSVLDGQPQIAALFNWEERVYEAAANTVSELATLALRGKSPDQREASLARLLALLAVASVGKNNVEQDRFRAVNGALLPILADRISVLKLRPKDGTVWQNAFPLAAEDERVSTDDAASLNSLLHLSTQNDIGQSSEPGAVIAFREDLIGQSFLSQFGFAEAALASEQFYCNEYVEDPARFRWMLVQIQAACDYAQRKPGTIPFALALELPTAQVKRGTKAQALWSSPPFRIDNRTAQLHVHSCFQVHLPASRLAEIQSLYRIREQLLRDLTFKVQSHCMRPGITS